LLPLAAALATGASAAIVWVVAQYADYKVGAGLDLLLWVIANLAVYGSITMSAVTVASSRPAGKVISALCILALAYIGMISAISLLGAIWRALGGGGVSPFM